MSKDWVRLEFDKFDQQYQLHTQGCGCCADSKAFPKKDWEDEEFYKPITLEDLDILEAHLKTQLLLVAELREKLG